MYYWITYYLKSLCYDYFIFRSHFWCSFSRSFSEQPSLLGVASLPGDSGGPLPPRLPNPKSPFLASLLVAVAAAGGDGGAYPFETAVGMRGVSRPWLMGVVGVSGGPLAVQLVLAGA
jgi:hypothetical protein